MAKRWALLLWASTLAAQQDGAPRPAYPPFRYDENWSSLADRSLRTDWLDQIKYISLGRPGWFVTIGGEIRERFELLDEPGFGVGPEDRNGYFLQRYLLSGDVHLGSRFRFFEELQSGLEYGRNGGGRPTDIDQLSLHQAFVDCKLPQSATTAITLRIGRQELGLGSGRLLSPAEGLNVRRSMDGVRLIVNHGKWTWNATALRLVKTGPGVFDDYPDHGQTYWGAGVAGPNPFWKGTRFSIHYHGIDRKNSVFERGVGRAIRHTLGVRAWTTEGPWDFNYEGFAQWGSFRGSPIRAWAFSEDSGYTARWGRFRPRFGLRSDVASGDHAPGDRALRSFDPLFPAAPVYSGPSGLLGPTNLIDVTPAIRMPLIRTVSLAIESSFFWRESLGDGVYTPFITPLRRGGSNPHRYVATAPSATVGWQADRHVFFSLSFTRFLAGSFFEMARPSRDVNYIAVWMAYRF